MEAKILKSSSYQKAKNISFDKLYKLLDSLFGNILGMVNTPTPLMKKATVWIKLSLGYGFLKEGKDGLGVFFWQKYGSAMCSTLSHAIFRFTKGRRGMVVTAVVDGELWESDLLLQDGEPVVGHDGLGRNPLEKRWVQRWVQKTTKLQCNHASIIITTFSEKQL
jgi:hypothetical protein